MFGDNVDNYILIDSKMRKIEKEFLKKLGYIIIEIKESNNVYEEISSHVDIFACKIKDKIILENNLYKSIGNKKYNFISKNIVCGKSSVGSKYPFDVPYNVCCVGNNVIHNFKYTDSKIMDVIKEEKLNAININQGYSNCSIAVIDDKSVILTDKKIATILEKYNIDVLLLEEKLDIKLLKNNGKYSDMSGFIGGCIARIKDKIVIFGDLKKIDKTGKIKEYIEKRNLSIIDFEGLDVIDYGGILELNDKK